MRSRTSMQVVRDFIRSQGAPMSLKERATEEFNRSPIAVAMTVLGVLIAFASLLVAWLQYAGPPALATSDIAAASAAPLRLTNLLLVTSFFLACSLSLASLIHFLDRSHPFHAMVLSVPAAVLSAFFSLLVFQLAPPRPLENQTLELAQDSVYWSTLFIFVAINGRSAAAATISMQPFVGSKSAIRTPLGDKQDAGAVMFLVVLQLLIWGLLVSAGLSKLVKVFLR